MNMKKTARQILNHLKKNQVMWFGVAAFFVLAWSVTGTSCTLRSITGLPCPGCGLTRAWILLLQGDLAAAWAMHPLFWMALPIVLVIAYLMIRNPDQLSSRSARFSWGLIAIVFVLVYLVRMVLYFPGQEPLSWNDQAFIPRIFRWVATVLGAGAWFNSIG